MPSRSAWTPSNCPEIDAVKDTLADAWLRPSLLDRLTDREPERAREPVGADRIDDVQLRHWVQRDLAWLLNTTHLAAGFDLSDYPEVARSVLNYGIADLTGRTLSSLKSDQLARQITLGLMQYESRLVRDTIEVRVSSAPNGSGRPTVFIEIAGVLRTEPLPVRTRVRAEVDVESGRVAIGEELFETGNS
jgi:type VI secretion system protein ImpF